MAVLKSECAAFLVGFGLLFGVTAIGLYWYAGVPGFSACDKPTRLEEWLAKRARRLAMLGSLEWASAFNVESVPVTLPLCEEDVWQAEMQLASSTQGPPTFYLDFSTILASLTNDSLLNKYLDDVVVFLVQDTNNIGY